MDTVTPEKRSEIMRSIRGKDTRPEMIVRRVTHHLGFRYRLHKKDLPGSPDLVFSSRKKVIFVHGCFWHDHRCRVGRHPKTRPAYWAMRFEKNRKRDIRQVRKLRRAGWKVLTVWECELADVSALSKRLRSFLGAPSRGGSITHKRRKVRPRRR
jgi:DNA mismatch endonuclease (patch repair protein)